MERHRKLWAGLSLVIAHVVLAAPAHADLTGDFEKFQSCPWESSNVTRCLYSETEAGEIRLGSRVVPIENPVLIQAGVGNANPKNRFARLFAASSGATMAEVPQNVPGGLLGIVAKPSSSPLVQMVTKLLFENAFLGLRATLELAGPPEDVKVNTYNLGQSQGTTLRLPVKIHLESPILGPSCAVGSARHPIVWELTSGKTSPPPPNQPIKGSFGTSTFLAEGFIVRLTKNKLVDNEWGAARATGCGGPLASVVNPMVNAQLEEAGPGHNSATLENTIELITTAALKFVDEKSS